MTFLLLCVGLAVFVKKNEARSYIDDGWRSTSPDVRGSLQQFFGCCGLNYWNDTDANWLMCPTGLAVNISCGDALANDFYKQFDTVGTCGIVFAVLMTLCIMFVCCLIRGIQRKNMKADVGGLHPGDDSANPTSLDTPGATASAAASATAPPPVSNV